jgi:transposase InsO family protein
VLRGAALTAALAACWALAASVLDEVDECLNQSWFVSLADACRSIGAWRLDYNWVRPHSSLGDLTPEAYAQREGLVA